MSETSVDTSSPNETPSSMATPAQPHLLQKTEPAITGAVESSASTTQTTPRMQAKPGTKKMNHITISPATTNQNLVFPPELFEQVFWPSPLRAAFKEHQAFHTVFKKERGDAGLGAGLEEFDFDWGELEPESLSGEKKFPGKIVALSEDFEAAEVEEGKDGDTAAAAGAGVKSATTIAYKGLISTIMTAYNRYEYTSSTPIYLPTRGIPPAKA